MFPHQEAEGEVSKEDLVEEVVEPADWSFTDILIPIPGCRVKWGSSGMKEWFTGLQQTTFSLTCSFSSPAKGNLALSPPLCCFLLPACCRGAGAGGDGLGVFL